jgi:hypothetical protein
MFGVPQPECRPCLQLVMWLNAYALSTKLISQVSAGGLQYGLCWFHRVARQETSPHYSVGKSKSVVLTDEGLSETE